MIRRLRPSAAMCVALLALFIAMSGTAVAAKKYLISSKSQIAPTVLKSLHGARGRTGKAGATGATGPAGATGAAGPKGDPGVKGDKGDPGPLLDTLPSGKTERGMFAAGGSAASSASAVGVSAVSFPIALAALIPAANVHFIKIGTTAPAPCTGSVDAPAAAPGHLCLYEGRAANVSSVRGTQIDTNDFSSTRWGFGIYTYSNGSSGEFNTEGSWAVTAP